MDFSEYNLWFFALIVLLGFAGGFLAGMLGVGGGLVFVPVFQEIVKNHEIAADRVPYVLANSLLIVFVVGISGSIKHIKIKNTHLQAALTTGLAAVSLGRPASASTVGGGSAKPKNIVLGHADKRFVLDDVESLPKQLKETPSFR